MSDLAGMQKNIIKNKLISICFLKKEFYLCILFKKTRRSLKVWDQKSGERKKLKKFLEI